MHLTVAFVKSSFKARAYLNPLIRINGGYESFTENTKVHRCARPKPIQNPTKLRETFIHFVVLSIKYYPLEIPRVMFE